jgi:hypothetical protein
MVTFPAFPVAEELIVPTLIFPIASIEILPPLRLAELPIAEVLILPAVILVPAFKSIEPPLLGEVRFKGLVLRSPVLISPLWLCKEIPAGEVMLPTLMLFVVIKLIATGLLGMSPSILMLSIGLLGLPTAPLN